ncbi:MAG TPA: hypothetical protein VGM03_20775 [Phycisphaerae bacterium]|jgi:hypothetical protein
MNQILDTDQQRREAWIARLNALADEVTFWCQSEGWAVERGENTIREPSLGSYAVPSLRITLSGGELLLNPIALEVIGGDGRVDLEAFPTLSRVKLVGDSGGWKIMTDSNIPLRQPWERQTFVQLAHDLLS